MAYLIASVNDQACMKIALRRQPCAPQPTLALCLLRGDDPIDASYVVDLVGDALAVMLHEEGGASSSAVPAEPVGAAD